MLIQRDRSNDNVVNSVGFQIRGYCAQRIVQKSLAHKKPQTFFVGFGRRRKYLLKVSALLHSLLNRACPRIAQSPNEGLFSNDLHLRVSKPAQEAKILSGNDSLK